MSDNRPEIDLPPDQYWVTGKRRPFWTTSRLILLWYVLAGPPVYSVAYWMVRGEWPEFVVRLVQSVH